MIRKENYIREKSIRYEISALANAEEKGIEFTKKVSKLFQKGESINKIAKMCGVTEEKIEEILE